MVDISFNPAGQFSDVAGDGIAPLANPTSLQFGPDGRLYVSEQSGRISAFTIEVVNGQYVATDHEVLTLPNGGGVVQSIMNHNDDGSQQPFIGNRQVTGILVAGTAENPVLYVSSSDPRIATTNDSNLDTNSGVVTRVTWTGTTWESVDILRGLPRSEENHANNGLTLSPDGTKLYVAVGGNTNNGAPSSFFTYTGEYALSGTVLEIDLVAINNTDSFPIKTDPKGTQIGGVALPRQYIYDLPTLDDPNIPNITDGVGEDEFGMDEAGPWGGRDGLNMAILPADAPLRIYADGFRNPYDLVWTQSGNLVTVDNGSNSGLGGYPIIDNDGEATNQPVDGGPGNPEPLFVIEEGGYYGHPAPARANQNLSWTVYNNSGTADTSLAVNFVPDLSALVPAGVNIQEGFLIDPSKFTGAPARLLESGIGIPYENAASPSLVNIGSSSNGLVEYTGTAFDGAIQGALIVAQFNNTITLLNINDAGTDVEPLIGPGLDGILGTADDVVVDTDGVYTLVGGLSTPLDVTVGPNGTIWVAEIGGNAIKAFAPGVANVVVDADNDGILNVDDPFIRDATNGTGVTLFPGQTLVWDLDPDQDGNLPGPSGFGGGLTGVMINGTTNFEEFFLEESTLPQQIIKLDNVKFTTAAGGGTTVIEYVSNGDAFVGNNNGEYLFHTGFKLAPTIESFKVKWSVINPLLTGPFQQIGGYIGTGDQSNYLKFVAIDHPNGEIQLLLEDDDIVVSEIFIQAGDLFTVPVDQKIFFELEIDPSEGTATPTVVYEIGGGSTKTVSGDAISLSGTNVLNTILGNYTVQGQTSGIAIGLYSSNVGQPLAPGGSFQAIFTDIEVTGTGDASSTVLYRVNAGGPEITAIDGGPNWLADGAFLLDPGSNSIASFPAVDPGSGIPPSTPGTIFDTERWDAAGGTEMEYGFAVTPGLYEVRLYLGNGFGGTSTPGTRVFDVAIEGQVLPNLNDIDLAADFGTLVGGVLSNVVEVTDGTLNIEFLHGIENPLVNGIEIIQLGGGNKPAISIVSGSPTVSEATNQVQISLLASQTIPSNEVVTVTFQIVPGTATPQADYTYTSPTATFNAATGTYTDTVTIAGSSSDVTFLINILQDTLIEGSETFTVNLVGVSSNAQLGTASSATVTILDDDTPIGGNVVVAINAGGPALTQNGINFVADTAFIGGGTYTDGSFDPDQPIFNGTIYETERFGGAPSGAPFSYSIPLAAGNYTVELYFAEIFQTTTGSRIFDVTVEGQLVLDDLDILAQTGGDINQPFVFTVPGVVSPNTFGAPDAIDISFQASADNAKVSGIVIRTADGTVTPSVVSLGEPDPASVEEEGDIGVTTLLFPVSFDVPPDTSITVEYSVDINGSVTTGLTQVIDTTGGDITVEVANDNIANGTEIVTVTLTGITVGSNIASLGTEVTAVGNVTEDDAGSDADFGLELLESLDADDGIATGGIYTGGEIGAASLSVMANVNNIQSSNFGAGSFQLTNTGDKKIAAVFIDFRNAVFGDSVVDFDGTGGDTAFKKFVVDGGGTDSTTGAFFDANNSNVYYLPGEPPLPNNTGTGLPSSGGFRGLLLKAGNTGNGFEPNETVGFSGDMDPNSVAGFPKSGIDSGAINSWDVGGISGAEIAGSQFFVLFDDGTTASGVLANNGTQAGSVGQAVQGQPEVPVNVIVNGGSGTYGDNGSEPTIVVTGPAGQTVKVVLAKGLQPVTNDVYEDLVEDRLAISQPEFPVNNAFDFQEVIVTIGQNGTITVPAGAFDYSGTESGVQFAGDDVAPIAISAVAVNGSGLAIGPVDREYLTNPTQTPVIPVEPESPGYFEVSGSGSNLYFKIQIEDAAALNGGTSPNGKWIYVTAPDSEGRQSGFQGAGYYLYGSNTSTSINQVNEAEILKFEIEVPQALVGQTMTFRIRASRDGLEASDQQNDVWFNVVSKAGTGSIEEYLVNNGANEAEPVSGEFIKIYGGPNNGTWGYAGNVDGAPNDFPVQLAFPEAGRYVLEVAGRSEGFHIDWIELFTGSTPALGASNSSFIPTGPQPVQLVSEIPDQSFADGTTDIFDLPTGTFFDPNGDPITYQVSVTAANGSDISGVTINETTGQISGLSTLAIDNYQVTITAIDADGAAADTFEINIVDEITLETLTIPVAAVNDDYEQFGGGGSSDLEMGLNGSQQEVGIRFAGITIPAGAEITNAFIRFTAFESNTNAASFTIGIQNSENAATFSSPTDLLSRTTAAELAWSDVESWTVGQTYNTPNLAALIQQVIGTDGVTDGALAFLINGTTQNSSRVAQTFGNGIPAELVIEFGSTGPTIPTVNLSVTPTQGSEADGTTITVTATATSAVTGTQTVALALSGTGINSSDFEGTIPTEITIADGQTQGSVTFTIADDTLIEGTETAIFSISNPSSGLVLGTVTTGQTEILDNEAPPVTSFTVEAESITNLTGYRLEGSSVASGGSMLSLVGGASDEIGTATFGFTGANGIYNVILGVFDENDGVSTFQLAKNGSTVGSVVLDQNLGSIAAVAATKVEKTIATGLTLATGDSLTVTGVENLAEHARFDFIRFEPAAPVTKQVSIAATTQAAEPATNGLFTVSLSQTSATPTVVAYSVTGTATAGSDYTALSGTVTIPANQLTVTIPVTVIDDTLIEGAESVIVTLSGVTGASDVALGSLTSATVNIADNDAGVLKTLTIAATTQAAEPGTNGLFTISLTEAATTSTVVSYTVGGTATPGADYTALSGTVTIPVGQTSATIPVAVLDDSLVEGSESVIVTLTGVTGAPDVALGSSTNATVTIADNDSSGTPQTLVIPVTLASDDYEQFGGGTSADLELGLNGSIAQEVGVRFTDITIPAGTTITNAYIAFTAFETSSGSANFTVGIQNSETAATFTSAQDLLGRTTAAELGWTNVEPWSVGQTYNTPNLASLIQQVIGADGVSSGSLAFLISGSGSRAAQTFNNGISPKLVIEFASSGSAASVVSIASTQNAVEPNTNGLFTVSLSQTSATSTEVSYSVGGTATSGSDYTALPGTVTIAANQLSATIPVTVVNDSLIEGTENVIVTLTGVTGASDIVLGATKVATVTIADDDQPLQTLLFEAELATTIVNYRVENIGAASGGKVLSFIGGADNETGSATFGFNEAPGSYNIIIGTFDENDGLASFNVVLNDFETGLSTEVGSLLLNANLGSGIANAQTKISATVATGIGLTQGDTITVNGFENSLEHARLDFLQLVPTV